MRGGVAVARLSLEEKILGSNPSPAAVRLTSFAHSYCPRLDFA